MPAMIFDTCCGCIKLRTGCLVIGYLQLVVEILLSIMMLIILASGTLAVTQRHNDMRQTVGGALLTIGAIGLLVLVHLLGFTITLLVGLHMNKRGPVKAYLIYAAIFLVLGVLGFFGSVSREVKTGQVGPIISQLISLALQFYFLLVIRSYYHKMDDSNKGQICNTA